jgi:Putative beta-barrel porin-2, OmpL-like. bbp2
VKNIRRFHLIYIFILIALSASAQTDSAWQQKPELSISGFADVFYVYDFNQPQGTIRQAFLYNHNRHHEFNLNLGLVKIALEQSKFRANIALQSGTYANDNYAAEPGVLKNIFEGNIGISLSKQNKLWLDAGVLPSPIGFESAVSMDNMTLTRSLAAENSPYFLTGVKLTLHPNEQWEIAGLLVNGWQRIQRVQRNSLPSFVTQVKFSPVENATLNWSTFIGTDDPDTTRRMRYFNNLYGKFSLSEKFNLIAGFDIGMQQEYKGSSTFDFWFTPVIVGQIAFNEKWKTSIRAEYYQDETGIIISTDTANGFQTTGLSLNLDYSPIQNILCRIEARWLNSKDKIFEAKTNPTNNNFFIGTSIAIQFSETLKK